jgi:outer membrane lipoprotein-sorting protein
MRSASWAVAAAMTLAAGAAAQEGQDPGPVIALALKGAGGAKHMTWIRAYTYSYEHTDTLGGRVQYKVFVQLPDRYRIEMLQSPGRGDYKRDDIITGDKGWSVYPAPRGPGAGRPRVIEMDAKEVERAKARLRFDSFLLDFAALKDPTYDVTALGDSEVDGRAVAVLRVTERQGTGNERRLSFDKQTGRLLQTEVRYRDPVVAAPARIVNSDYRTIDGITLPGTRTVYVGGSAVSFRPPSVAVLGEFKFVDKLDPNLFEKP